MHGVEGISLQQESSIPNEVISHSPTNAIRANDSVLVREGQQESKKHQTKTLAREGSDSGKTLAEKDISVVDIRHHPVIFGPADDQKTGTPGEPAKESQNSPLLTAPSASQPLNRQSKTQAEAETETEEIGFGRELEKVPTTLAPVSVAPYPAPVRWTKEPFSSTPVAPPAPETSTTDSDVPVTIAPATETPVGDAPITEAPIGFETPRPKPEATPQPAGSSQDKESSTSSGQPTSFPSEAPLGMPPFMLAPTPQPNALGSTSPPEQDRAIPGLPTVAPAVVTLAPVFKDIGSFPLCEICGGGMVVSRPNGQVTLVGASKPFECSVLENAGMTGYVEPTLCEILPNLISDCGCIDAPTVSPRPSEQPTVFPTARPTHEPSAPPTVEPTPKPSPRPSRNPTRAPTRTPTRAPTPSPAKPQELIAPSAPLPTSPPVIFSPSFTPTVFPSSSFSSSYPSVPASEFSSMSPSRVPTIMHSTLPTVVPSTTPTVLPSGFPSSSPSLTESALPTTQPSSFPSNFDSSPKQLSAVDMIMELAATNPLSAQSTKIWEDVLQTHIGSKVRTMNQGLLSLTVESDLKEQSPKFVSINSPSRVKAADSESNSNRRLSEDRRLQRESLTIIFDVDIFLRSDQDEYTAYDYISGAFDTIKDRNEFVAALRAAANDTVFEETSDVKIFVPTSPPTVAPAQATERTGMVVGLVAALLSGIALAAYFLKTQHKKKMERARPPDPQSIAASGDDDETNEYATHIDMKSHDDISTLGDPIPAGLNREPSLADSASLNYDFKKSYGKDGPSVAPSVAEASLDSTIGTATLGTIGTKQYAEGDDEIDIQYLAENQFEVDAPPGMLGLVLESSGDGTPSVHAIKPSSPLASQVKVGDRLLAVDGEDVTILLSSDVSRLIATKRDNPIRRFLFTRPSSSAGKMPLQLPVIPQEAAPSETWNGVKASKLAMIPQETTDTEMSSKDPLSSGQTACMEPSESEATLAETSVGPLPLLS